MLVLVCNQKPSKGIFMCQITSEQLLALRKVGWKNAASWEKPGGTKLLAIRGPGGPLDLSDLHYRCTYCVLYELCVVYCILQHSPLPRACPHNYGLL